MPKRKRANGEGNISKRTYTRKDGSTYDRFQASLSMGYDGQGKRKRVTVYGETQKEVKDKLEALKRQIHDGIYSDSKLKVKEFLATWLKEKKGQVKPRTHESYAYSVKQYVNPRIGNYQLAKLSPLQVQTAISSIASEVGTRTANLCRTLLLGAFNQAIRWQLVARNPVEGVETLKEEKKEMQLWSPQEAVYFLDTARAHRLYAFFYLAMSTGMRRGELLGLRWQDIKGEVIQVQQNLISIAGKIAISTPKSKSGFRAVSISSDVIEVISLHKQQHEAEKKFLGLAWVENDLVFTTGIGTPIHPRNLDRSWTQLQKKARGKRLADLAEKLTSESLLDEEQTILEAEVKAIEQGKLFPKIRLHDLRHLHASLAIKQGMDAKMLAERLGHSRASMTLDVYTHLFEEQRQKSSVNLKDALGGDQNESN